MMIGSLAHAQGEQNGAAPMTMDVMPDIPSGFSESAGPLGGIGEGILDGFHFSTSLSALYNNNITQSPGQPIAPVLDDFILSLGGMAGYRTTGSDWTFGAAYNGNYNTYLDNSRFNAYNQSGSINANYQGGRLSASLNTGISYNEGANRFFNTAEIVKTTSISNSLNARYQVSSKTSLAGNLGYSFTTSRGNYNDTRSFNAGVSALWRYSSLTEFGPGLRYTRNTGGGGGDRTSIGPTMSVNYRLSTKVSLTSQVGADFVSYDSGGSADPTLFTRIGVNYRASDLWGMNLSLVRDARADPSQADAYNEITALRLGYNRRVRRATLNLGVSVEKNSFEASSNSAAVPRDDRDYFAIDGSLGMPVFSNTTSASVFMRYNEQRGSARDTYDAFQCGLSLSRQF